MRFRGAGLKMAFTLIEVMCAVAIGAMLLVVLGMTYSGTIQVVEQARAMMRPARLELGISRIVGDDIAAACVVWEKELPAWVGRKGKPDGMLSESEPFLEFFSTHSLAPSVGMSGTRIYRIEYSLRPSPDADATYQPVRSEIPYHPGKTLDRSKAFTAALTSEVSSWRIRYFDGQNWRDSWESKQSIPEGVQLRFVLASTGMQRDSIRVAVPLVSKDTPFQASQ